MKKFVNLMLIAAALCLMGLGVKELCLFVSVSNDNAALRAAVLKVPDSKVRTEETEATENVPGDTEINEPYPEDPFNRCIDFAVLKTINPDIAGWIYIPDTKVDYPILIGDTDEQYLNRDFHNYSNRLGSIFAFSNVNLDADGHVCLFGHNMISGQMFGELKKYNSEKFSEDHNMLYIYTPEKTKSCKLISVFGCEKSDSIFKFKVNSADLSENESEEFKDAVISRSMFKLKDTPAEINQIYTLGTCSGKAGGTHRLTVNFQVVEEKYVLS